MKSRFEAAIDQRIAETGASMFKVALGDSHLHAKLVGVAAGLESAKQIHRDTVRADIVEDAA